MAGLVSLSRAQDHCRVEPGADDDALLGAIDAATAYMVGPRGVLGAEVKSDYAAGFPDGVPPELVAAALMHIASLYDERQTGVPCVLTDWYHALIAPYRDLV